MRGFEVRFNVYANSQEEANLASKAFAEFINEHAKEGRAVTANKLAEAIPRWKDNFLVRNKIIQYFK